MSPFGCMTFHRVDWIRIRCRLSHMVREVCCIGPKGGVGVGLRCMLSPICPKVKAIIHDNSSP